MDELQLELILQWHDITTTPRAHLIMMDIGDWVVSMCGKEFPARDVIVGSHENRQCKTCARHEKKARA